MDKNQEGSRELLSEAKELIFNNKYHELREMLEEYHVMDILDMMEQLDEEMKQRVFDCLTIDLAAQVLEESESEQFKTFVINTDPEHIITILENMSLGDLADILKELEPESREAVIGLLNDEDSKAIKELLFYEEDTSGSTMTTGYISVYKDMNAQQAIKVVRTEGQEADTIYYIYVVDDEGSLVGVVSLKDLITARDSALVEDLMVENIISVGENDDREEAVRLVSKYDLLAIPVVDSLNHIKGIIMVDDIIDVIEEENTEDMYKFAGSSEHERDAIDDENSTFFEQVISSVRGRLPWLILTILGGLVAAKVFTLLESYVNYTSGTIFYYVPLIIGMGGNIGSQAAAVTAIVLNSNEKINTKLINKELVVGLITGVVCAVIAAVILYFFEPERSIYMIVSITILINMVVGASIGVLIPSIVKKLDEDTFFVSTPLITTILDIVGIAIYTVVAVLILR